MKHTTTPNYKVKANKKARGRRKDLHVLADNTETRRDAFL